MGFNLNTKKNVDYLTLDYEGFRQMMIDHLKERLPEYTDYSETDMGMVLIELTAHGLDVVSYYKDRQALECFLETAKERKSVIMHCKNLGYKLSSSSPSIFYQVFEKKPEEPLAITRGSLFTVKTKSERGESAIPFEVVGGFNGDGVYNPNLFEIPVGATGMEVENGDYKYKAVVVQGQTHRDKLGFSDGTAYQKFNTNYSPAMDYTETSEFNELVVEVYVVPSDVVFDISAISSSDPEVRNSVEKYKWTRNNDFLLAKAVDKCYTFNVNEYGEGTVEFGNGISGAIPPENHRIWCIYRTGGGTNTNVGANTITDLASGNNYPFVLNTFNPDTALVYGSDMESLEMAKVKAPASLRALDRAVIERDYEDIGLVIRGMQSAQSLYVSDLKWDYISKYPTTTNPEITKYVKDNGLSSVPVRVPNTDTPTKGRMQLWLLPENAEPTSNKLFNFNKNFSDFFTNPNLIATDGSLILKHMQVEFPVTEVSYRDYDMSFSLINDSLGRDASTQEITGIFSLNFHMQNGAGYVLKYEPQSGKGLALYSVGVSEPIASNAQFEMDEGCIYKFTIKCLNGGLVVKRDGEEVLVCSNVPNLSNGNFYFSTDNNYSARLITFKFGEISAESGTVFISDDMMDYLVKYYDDRRMVGQHLDIYPANIEYVTPTLRIAYDKVGYVQSEIISKIRTKLFDLLSLGKRNLNQPLIWSDLVRELTNPLTGVAGLKSVTFIEDVTVGGETLETFKKDLPQKYGVLYVLNETKIDIRVD